MPLDKYREKRDFTKTPEPPPSRADGRGPLMFVIQKHAATRLHYDVRFEIDGVLVSWPVPKGPSTNPAVKRMAVMTEDHPMDYASFEGVIPKGEYGAGQVIVWDAGTYSPDEGGRLSFDDRDEANRRMRESVEKGKLSVFLRGQKLKGSWTLVKTKTDWLMIKHRDRFADAERDVTQEDRSIISGLTIEDLKAGRLPDRGKLVIYPWDADGARETPMPRSVEPMAAALAEHPFSSSGWLFEPKLDGVRAIAFLDGGRVKLVSRRGLDATRQYPGIVEELKFQTEAMILDGEIAALDEHGVPSFQLLQQRLNLQNARDIKKMDSLLPVVYYVFDLLHAAGWDLRGAALRDRRTLLRQLLLPGDRVRLVDAFETDGEAAYEAVKAVGLEGLIAKRVDSVYEPGKRSKAWLKIKHTLEDEFVIGGYQAGEGGRAGTFGSLLVGQYDAAGRLVYAGNVGSGFDDRTLAILKKRLDAIATDERPFAEPPSRGAMGFGRPKGSRVVWVRPELVARVKFAQWTSDGHLRAPSFLGLREDKAPAEVRREVPVPVPETRDPAGGETVAELLEQLETKADKATLRVDGHRIPVTNLDKPLWPAHDGQRALTKRDLLRYFAEVSPYLLPHMKDRPLTLTRYPNGITGPFFYQKRWDGKLPRFVETVVLWSGHNESDVEYLMCNNLATLIWLGQLADIELHTWYSRVNPDPDGHHLPLTFAGSEKNIDASLLNYPDFVVFDLDPYIYAGTEKSGDEPALNRKAFLKTCEVALWLKEVLDSLSLSSFVKTTGRTGLHVYVPVLRQLDSDALRAIAETIGRFLVRAHPRDVTMEWAVQKRTGKVFFDHNQNVRGKTLASVYSPRPSPQAAVSMPVRWDELMDVYPTDFTILTACDRIREVGGDLWGDILAQKHDVESLLNAIGDAEAN